MFHASIFEKNGGAFFGNSSIQIHFGYAELFTNNKSNGERFTDDLGALWIVAKAEKKPLNTVVYHITSTILRWLGIWAYHGINYLFP